MDLQILLIIAPPILLALTFHEYSHAYVASRFGDDTAKLEGRLTMNPLAHLDPLGTIMIFLVRFGWAKPVPVNPVNLSDPKRQMLWISAAGPLSNIALAFASGILVRTGMGFGVVPSPSSVSGIVLLMLIYSVQINLALAIFNVLPVAPLDGSKILFGLLPPQHEYKAYYLQQYGPYLLLGLILFGYLTGVSILGVIIWPFVRLFSSIFAGI